MCVDTMVVAVAGRLGVVRALHAETPSAVHPLCEAVLELDRNEDLSSPPRARPFR
jgi:hypothetical protein